MVRDVKRVGMAEAVRGEMYRPYRQICWGFLTLVVRTQRDPADLTRAVRAELDLLDKDLPLERVQTMTQLVSANLAQRRLSVHLLGGFGAGALLLSALGLYGVLAYMVTQRTREIGIRMALGAQRRAVLGLVIGQGMRLACIGVALGLLGAFVLTRVLQRLLYEIEPTDPLTFITVSFVLASAALLACWLPARRAAKVDPMEAFVRSSARFRQPKSSLPRLPARIWWGRCVPLDRAEGILQVHKRHAALSFYAKPEGVSTQARLLPPECGSRLLAAKTQTALPRLSESMRRAWMIRFGFFVQSTHFRLDAQPWDQMDSTIPRYERYPPPPKDA